MRKLSVCLAVLLVACGGSSPAGPGVPAPPPVAAVSLASVTVAPSTVAGGAAAVGTVTLTAAAPANGASVSLSSSHAAVRVSSVLVVPSGATSATFAVATETLSSDTDVTISGTLDGVTKTATLRITGASSGSGPLVGLTTSVDDIVSGDSTTGTITAAAPAPAGGIRVTLTSSDSDVTVPSSVVISAGATSATFDIRTSVVFAEKEVRLTASLSNSLQPAASQLVAAIKLRVPRPRLDSVSPANGTPGSSVSVTLVGAMFVPGATVSVSGSGVTVGTVVIDSLSSIRTTLTIASSAAAGERQISVSTAGGSSSAAFNVGSAPPPPPAPLGRPTITSIQPNDLRRSTTGGMAIYGTNFAPGITVSISGIGARIDSPSYVYSTTMISVGFYVDTDAPLGPRTVTVTTSGGTSEPYTIEVLPRYPVVYSMSPATGVMGTTVDVNIVGQFFIEPLTVSSTTCAAITVSNATFVSSTQVTARLTIANSYPSNNCFIAVNTASASPGAYFQVLPPPPTITNISGNPYTGMGPITMIITGTNFYGNVSVQVTGGGVTVGHPYVSNPYGILVTMTLDPNFTSGNRTITVTTPGGTSNAVTWTINRPSLSGGQ